MKFFIEGFRICSISSVLIGVLFFLGCNEDTIDPVFYGSLKGTVLLSRDSLPAEGVEISTNPATSIVYTDSLGHYSFPEIPTGNYAVLAKLEGFKNQSKNITIAKEQETQADLFLERNLGQPPAPTLDYPENGQDSVSLSTTLKWIVENKLKDDLTYSVTLYEANVVTPIINVQNLTDTALAVSNLKFNTVYYWQVKVKNESENVTSGDLWSFKTLPFPDNRFVYASTREGNFEIYSNNEDGNNEARLTYSSNAQVFPQYSHDRNLIAFASLTDLEFHLYTMKKNGTEVTKVSSLPLAGNHNPGKGFCWSPDNGKLLYSHYDQLYTIDRNGTNLTLVATAPAGRHFRSCDWTQIGNKVVVETVGVLPYDTEINLIDLSNGTVTPIINNLPGIVQSPTFSIDGTKVLYTHDVSGFEVASGRQLDSHIFSYDIGTGISTDLTDDKPAGTNDLNPRFSPTGAEIIFENSSNDGSGVTSIWKMKVSDGSRELLFTNASMPDWK